MNFAITNKSTPYPLNAINTVRELMQLVRQVQFKRSQLLDEITFLSKNLFNVATYMVRQRFFKDRHWIRYHELWNLLKSHDSYQKLQETCGSHPPQQVLKQVDRNFKSFFNAIKTWKKEPSKFQGIPKLPHYKRKNGRNLLYFTSLQCRLRDGVVLLTRKLEQLEFPRIKTDLESVKGVRIVPFGDRYNIELIYDYEPRDLHLNENNIMGIDLGLTNIVTTSDNIGNKPMIIKGGVVKSINQFYNKQLAKYKSLSKKCNDANVTRRILKLHRKRNNKVRDFFHKTSRTVVNYCIVHDIGTIVIGYNEGWKQNVNIGKKNNQNFVSIPFLQLVRQIEYKSEMVGIKVVRITEEYTSQACSSCGIVRKSNRKYRGLYVCKECGMVLNADVNASRNMIHKGVPESTWIGDRGCLNHPIVLKV
ncbi:MAG: RNA-guided endonuclease InsQ/TnpB family protein [Promethearchaeota archaeon]